MNIDALERPPHHKTKPSESMGIGQKMGTSLYAAQLSGAESLNAVLQKLKAAHYSKEVQDIVSKIMNANKFLKRRLPKQSRQEYEKQKRENIAKLSEHGLRVVDLGDQRLIVEEVPPEVAPDPNMLAALIQRLTLQQAQEAKSADDGPAVNPVSPAFATSRALETVAPDASLSMETPAPRASRTELKN